MCIVNVKHRIVMAHSFLPHSRRPFALSPCGLCCILLRAATRIFRNTEVTSSNSPTATTSSFDLPPKKKVNGFFCIFFIHLSLYIYILHKCCPFKCCFKSFSPMLGIQFWWRTTESHHFSFYFLAEKQFLEYEPQKLTCVIYV